MHPDTTRSAPPVAATVPASAVRPEPALMRWMSPSARQALPEQWLIQGNKKAKEINSVLGPSQLNLLWRSRFVPWRRLIYRHRWAESAALGNATCQNVSRQKR